MGCPRREGLCHLIIVIIILILIVLIIVIIAHGEKVCATSVTRGPRLTRMAGLRAGPGKKGVDLRGGVRRHEGGSAVLCSVFV